MVAIACGTSVLMFVDLVSYILRKNIFKAAKVVKSTYRLFANENFQRLHEENFKFVLMSTFAKRSAVIGRELFEAADANSKEFVFNNFEYYLRITEDGTPRWDDQFYAEHIDSSAAKVIVCGSPSAVADISQALERIKLPKSKLWHI